MNLPKATLVFACASMLAAQAFAGSQPKQAFADASNTESATVVSSTNFVSFLRAAGFEPTKVHDRMYKVIAGANSRTITLQLTDTGYMLYAEILVANLPQASAFPARLREQIAQQNWETSPAYYTISDCTDCAAAKRSQLHLSIAMFNDGMSPESFRKHIDLLTRILENDRTFWDIDYTISRR